MLMVTVAPGSSGLPSATPSAELPPFAALSPFGELELDEHAAPVMPIPAATTSATTVRDPLRFMRVTPDSMDGDVPCRCHPACGKGTAVNRGLQECDGRLKEHDWVTNDRRKL